MSDTLTLTRTFDAPAGLVWKAWTDPEILKRWWGPTDYTCPQARMDVRVGGKYLIAMQGPDGKVTWGTGEYLQVEPLSLLVMTDSFADEQGNVVPAATYGMGDSNLPLQMQIRVEFAEEDGKTTLTITHSGLQEVSDKMVGDMEQGWNEMFDKLETELGDET